MRDLRSELAARSDQALAAAFVVAAAAEQLARTDTEHSVRALVWIVALAAPVLVRRSHPALGTCVAAALVLAWPAGDGHFPPAVYEYVWPVVLAYSCGAHAPTLYGLVATVSLAVAIQVFVGFSEAPNLEIAIITLPPWWMGRQVRRRRELVRELADRTRELAAEEEAFIRLSVERERARIARDLHDIVSHHLAVVVIQAGAGRLADGADPELATGGLAAIRDAGLHALAETDRLVAMLGPGESGALRLAPLLARARAIGARVAVSPSNPALAPDIEAVAYRVAQEALTNAMKHAPGAPLDLRVAATDAELVITARNDGGAQASTISHTGSGLGLDGMRERVAALGGTVAAGPEADGGFRLCARLPLAPPGR
ncbi:MAG TPA: histidine kinase [Solirubrobacteraceae bacterium]|jgi:signal transduction histidine kinase